MLGRKRGQSTLEYALVIAVVITALLAINLYMRKGVQGRLKTSTDEIGKQFDPTTNFTTTWQTQASGTTTTSEARDTATGGVTSTISSGETITKSEHEDWGSTPTQHY